MEYDLNRFKQAQASKHSGYTTALEEIKVGCKSSHWIWYIFPQFKGLGRSYNANFFGLDGIEEVKAYYEDYELRCKLLEITNALLDHKGLDIRRIMGGIDSVKLRSCMTLFDIVAPNGVFTEVLSEFFDSERDPMTLSLCKAQKLNRQK